MELKSHPKNRNIFSILKTTTAKQMQTKNSTDYSKQNKTKKNSHNDLSLIDFKKKRRLNKDHSKHNFFPLKTKSEKKRDKLRFDLIFKN